MRLAAGLGVVLAMTGPFFVAPASAASTLRFHSVQYDSPGPDNRSLASLNAEWISLVNEGPAAVNLAGWSVRDPAGHAFTFGRVRIAGKGGRVRVHTGSGNDSGAELYWNRRAYVWNNTADTARLLTPSGKLYATCAWKSESGRTATVCRS
jgi:hypothetical protein